MRKIALAVVALAGVAFVVPAAVVSAHADTKKVIIKRGHGDRMHEHMRDRHHGKKVVIIKKRGHHRDM